MICALSVSVGQIIKQGEPPFSLEQNVAFFRRKHRFHQRKTFLYQQETSLPSERNVACVREKHCFHQRETLLASEGNSLSIGIPSLFLLFLSNYLHGEKYFSVWRKILFSMETRIYLRRDNSIPSVAKSGKNGWKSNTLPFIAVSAQQKKSSITGKRWPNFTPAKEQLGKSYHG